jgi:hypothetical protein
VSNYNHESLKGFEELVIIGAEVINGTGDVKLTVRQHEGEDADTVILHFTPDQALDFARLLSRQAHEARRAKWNEENLYHG